MFKKTVKRMMTLVMAVVMLSGATVVPANAAKVSQSFKGTGDIKGILMAPKCQESDLYYYLGALSITDGKVDVVNRTTATDQLVPMKDPIKAKFVLSKDKKLITMSFKDIDSDEMKYFFFKKDSKGELQVAYSEDPKKPVAYTTAKLFKDIKSATTWMKIQKDFKPILQEEIDIESLSGIDLSVGNEGEVNSEDQVNTEEQSETGGNK